jgi:hypothetical protein
MRLYLWLALVDLHGGAYSCLHVVPLGLRGVEYLHGVRPSRDLEPEIPGVHSRGRMYREVIYMYVRYRTGRDGTR